MKWAIACITGLHGIIHLMGFFHETGLKKLEGFSGETILHVSSAARTVGGYIWLLAALLFGVVIFGLVTDASWWRTLAIIAVVVSQLLIIVWWPDAKAGTIANILLLIIVFTWKN